MKVPELEASLGNDQALAAVEAALNEAKRAKLSGDEVRPVEA